jgi:hypothetical protein
MNVALKEWASVIAALGSGMQIMLLRKGGIVEAARGGFELRHRQFLLFPTFEHQHSAMLKPGFQDLVVSPSDLIRIQYVAEVSDIFTAPSSLEAWSAFDGHFIWNDAYLRIRYDYRPDLPLYIILLRVSRLQTEHRIADRPSYAGCKSWVHLSEEIPVTDAEPVLDDKKFQELRTMYIEVLCAS